MKHLVRLMLFVFINFISIFGSSPSFSPKIVIENAKNRTPFALGVIDRCHDKNNFTRRIEKDSKNIWNYRIDGSQDVPVEACKSGSYDKLVYLAKHARFEFALLNDRHQQIAGKSSYFNVAWIKANNLDDDILVFRTAHDASEKYFSPLRWQLSKCSNCNNKAYNSQESPSFNYTTTLPKINEDEEHEWNIICAPCLSLQNKRTRPKKLSIDLLLLMHQKDLDAGTGKITFGVKVDCK